MKESLFPSRSEEYRKMQQWLNTKTLIISCFVCLTRVYYLLMGIAPWRLVYDSLDKRNDIHIERAQATEEFVLHAMISMTVVGIILNITILKKRNLAVVLIYLETLFVVLHSIVPYDYGDTKDAYLLARMIFVLFNFSSNPKIDVWLLSLTQAVVQLVILPLIYKEDSFSTIALFMKIQAVVYTFAICLAISMLFTYISLIKI